MQQERASKRQQELLSFVEGFIKGNGYGPSYREIMQALGYKSVSTVAVHVEGLISKGYLRRRDKSARSLEVVSENNADTDTPASSATLEDQLRNRIRQRTLSDEETVQVNGALRLLGIELELDETTTEAK